MSDPQTVTKIFRRARGMNVKDAIINYSQGEKIKSGIIWVNQTLELLKGLPEIDKKGAEAIIRTMIDLIAGEIHLSNKLLKNDLWKDVQKKVDLAIVMINSGVADESSHHLTQALSHATSICHRSMSILKEENLI
jgi:hypothetical protein